MGLWASRECMEESGRPAPRPGDVNGFLELLLRDTPTADLLRVIRKHPETWAAAKTDCCPTLNWISKKQTADPGFTLLQCVLGRRDDCPYPFLPRSHVTHVYTSPAFRKRVLAIAKELVRAGANVDATCEDDRFIHFTSYTTMLIGAVQAGHARSVREVLALGADPNRPNGGYYVYGSSPLHCAALKSNLTGHRRNLQVVRDLLAHGATVNSRDGRNQTPVWLAAKAIPSGSGGRDGSEPLSIAILAELIYEGADPHAKTYEESAHQVIRRTQPEMKTMLKARVQRIKERTAEERRGLAAALSELGARCGETDLAVGIYVNTIGLFTGDTPARFGVLERYVATI